MEPACQRLGWPDGAALAGDPADAVDPSALAGARLTLVALEPGAGRSHAAEQKRWDPVLAHRAALEAEQQILARRASADDCRLSTLLACFSMCGGSGSGENGGRAREWAAVSAPPPGALSAADVVAGCGPGPLGAFKRPQRFPF